MEVIMTIEWILLFLTFWFAIGLIDAWILHRRHHADWPWLVVCALTGPVSIAVVFDQIYLADPGVARDEVETTTAAEEPAADSIELGSPAPDLPADWPEDDPESRLMLYGYRGLSDH
jgi:hypothetical protein